MPTDHHLDPEEDALVQLGYETEDVEYKKLGKSIGYFFGFVIFCGVAGVGIFGYFIGFDKLRNPPDQTSPFVSRIPPQDTPLLQTNVTNRTDIRDLRKEESELLHGTPSWVDKDKGIVRIPVEKAIDMYLSRTVPNAPIDTTMKSGTPPIITAPKEEAPE